ncbi:hypothetical protein MNAN1_003152 [Malassezia nana]|uniref:triacylglycerol lipase n=1 Tax=Malassezia nana TaxID=180528 RepID=A0AAF0J3G7_9BASI|nr:hypothetical protein MNAN1_003152 [Malassezia nana]
MTRSTHKTYDQLVKPENYNGTMKDELEMIDGRLGKKIGPAHAVLYNAPNRIEQNAYRRFVSMINDPECLHQPAIGGDIKGRRFATWSLLWFAFFLLWTLSIALQAQALAIRASPQVPSEDPFYRPPSGWKDAKPGTVFRSRQVEIHAFLKAHVKEAWQLLYRTNFASDDEPTTTVTTVIVPYNAKQERLVLYAEYQDSNGEKCMPSFSYQAGFTSDLSATMNMASVLVFLQEGYIVTVPDKQGKRNMFAAGHVEGHQTLDGIRATLSFDKLGFSNDTRVAGWGYSGGAIQSGWAASLKKTYAPELNMVGWYAGGTPSNLTDLIVNVNKGFFSGFLFSGLLGLSRAYPSLNETLERISKEKLKEGLEDADKLCMMDMLAKYPSTNLLTKDYTSLGDRLLATGEVKDVLDQQIMGIHKDETPDTPVLMAHGAGDEIVPFRSAYTTYENWCKNGAQVEFMRFKNPLAGHFSTQLTSMAPTFEWIRDRLEGKPAKPGCSESSTMALFINPDYLGQQFKDVLGVLAGLLGQKIGPGDSIFKKTISGKH